MLCNNQNGSDDQSFISEHAPFVVDSRVRLRYVDAVVLRPVANLHEGHTLVVVKVKVNAIYIYQYLLWIYVYVFSIPWLIVILISEGVTNIYTYTRTRITK